MTSGVKSATDHFYGQAIFPFFIAAIISLNGLSIHMQVFVIAKTCNISMTPLCHRTNMERHSSSINLFLIY